MRNLLDLIQAKALQSKIDNRFADFIRLNDNGTITLDIQGIGYKDLEEEVVYTAFEFHDNYPSLIKGWLRNQVVDYSRPYSDAEVYEISRDVQMRMSQFFAGISYKDCYMACREILSTNKI